MNINNMGVSDIIGTDASTVETTSETTAQPQVAWNGLDPQLAQYIFGIWAIAQVSLGSYVGIRKWNYDNDNSSVTNYEYVYRLAAGVLAVPYLAPALGFFYMIKASVTKMSENVIYGYYLTCFASVISPQLGFFLVELLYLYCYT